MSEEGSASRPESPCPTAGVAEVRYQVDPWSPEYGVAEVDDVLSAQEVVVDVEMPAHAWCAVVPDTRRAVRGPIAFLDGVLRIDARAWVYAGAGVRPSGAVCASCAAGVVLTGQEGRVRLADVEVQRWVVTSNNQAPPMETEHSRWATHVVRDDRAGTLWTGVHDRMSMLEARMASAWCGRAELCLIDGPLRRVDMPPGAVGYIKTHSVRYLPDELDPLVAQLRPGERTPLFVIVGPNGPTYSWYLRLPGPAGHPWAGVVRGEVAGGERGIGVSEAVEMAGRAAATLPHYASSPHRDPRAPQNLIPVGGLETFLKHRLGDRELLHRGLLRLTR